MGVAQVNKAFYFAATSVLAFFLYPLQAQGFSNLIKPPCSRYRDRTWRCLKKRKGSPDGFFFFFFVLLLLGSRTEESSARADFRIKTFQILFKFRNLLSPKSKILARQLLFLFLILIHTFLRPLLPPPPSPPQKKNFLLSMVP